MVEYRDFALGGLWQVEADEFPYNAISIIGYSVLKVNGMLWGKSFHSAFGRSLTVTLYGLTNDACFLDP